MKTMTEVSSVDFAVTVPTRAAEIIRLHDEVTGHLKTSLEKAIRIGELLTDQKESMAHGAFTPWVKENLPFTDRTARNYMHLHRERDRLKTETVSDLKTAYKMLSPPKSETFKDIIREFGFNCETCLLHAEKVEVTFTHKGEIVKRVNPKFFPPCLCLLSQNKDVDLAALILRLYQSVKEKRQDDDPTLEYESAQDLAARISKNKPMGVNDGDQTHDQDRGR
jgi:hypothetical protein